MEIHHVLLLIGPKVTATIGHVGAVQCCCRPLQLIVHEGFAKLVFLDRSERLPVLIHLHASSHYIKVSGGRLSDVLVAHAKVRTLVSTRGERTQNVLKRRLLKSAPGYNGRNRLRFKRY
jgi:hypothetical protein